MRDDADLITSNPTLLAKKLIHRIKCNKHKLNLAERVPHVNYN